VPVVAVVVAVGLVAGGFALGFNRRDTAATAPSAAATPLSITQASPPSTHATSAQVIKQILPSVVNVRVTEITSNPFGGSQSAQAEGSGVVISKDGIIVTNAHVVTGATSVKVVFTDGHASLDGTVLGVDTTHDLAVIKVNANDLTPITVGSSSSLLLGDQVFAIGFPLGLGPTVTEGIVSGLNRTVDVQRADGSPEHLVGLLQTDAAINPGNSGGALVNSAGQLVGINTAAAQAGSAENVGFSIAIDSALPIIRQLATEAPSQRAWLGVAAGSVDSSVAAALGLPAGTQGAVISSVFSGSPAEKAGLQANEVIVSFGGTTIRSESDLSSAIAAHKPGDTVQLDLVSAQGNRTVTVTLGTRPPGV
jgi:S1-C subfamily serine protease